MSMRPDEWEINHAVRLLEGVGYIVLRPTEAELPVVVEIEEASERRHFGFIGIRLEVEQRGQRFCLHENVPLELACNPDDPDFRDNHLPRILTSKLGRHLADAMLPQVVGQVKEKIKPFVPANRLSLAEIEGFIAMALDARYSREDVDAAFPQFRDEIP